jgi:hypothetical protein
MSKQAWRIGAGAFTSAAIAGALAWVNPAGAASTSTPDTLSGIQAKAAAAISLRINDLNAAIAKVNADEYLGSGQATLDNYLGVDIPRLETLGSKIAADTTVDQAKSDYSSIFSDYRVLALVLPAAWQAADADRITNTDVPKLTAFSAKAQSHVNATNQATLQPMIDALNGDISGATNAASGVASTVLSYVPSQWNANNALLDPTKSSLQTANAAVKNGWNEEQQITQYLKSSRPALKTAPTTTTPTTTAPTTTTPSSTPGG